MIRRKVGGRGRDVGRKVKSAGIPKPKPRNPISKPLGRKGVPRLDGSGKGVGANRGRGGCKPIRRDGLKRVSPITRGGRNIRRIK